MNKQKVWLAWARFFLALLAMGMLGCEVPTDGKFESRITGAAISAPGGWSTPGGSTGELPAPTGVKAEAQANGSIKVSWISVYGATSYSIYFADNTAGNDYEYEETTETEYIHWHVSPGQTWYYKVLASNATGNSPLSDYASATVMGSTPGSPDSSSLAVPQNFKAESIYEGIRLTWDPVPDAEGYTIYWGESVYDNFLASDYQYTIYAPTTFYIDSDISSDDVGNTWYYKIRAFKNDSAVTSDLSTATSVIVDYAPYYHY